MERDSAARRHSRCTGGGPVRGRTGRGNLTLWLRQVKLAQQMYDEKDEYGKRRYTVEQIAAEFGVTRPTIYRHLGKMSAADRRVT